MYQNMKIIFLDFDGVCTSYYDDIGSYITHDPSMYGPSRSCIERLRNLCEDVGAKIIVSSNWRKFDEDGNCSFWTHPNYHITVQNPLPKLKREIGDLIIGTIPKLRHVTKTVAIKEWFVQNSVDDDFKYVIFDDDQKEGLQDDDLLKSHFILTKSDIGLSDRDCQKAKAILS